MDRLPDITPQQQKEGFNVPWNHWNPVEITIFLMELDNESVSDFIGVRMTNNVPLEHHSDPAFGQESTLQMVRCCMCGTSIPANPTGTCSFCLTNSVDATEGIERNLVMPYCRHCNRYQRPPWLPCEWESRELLALCLKRIRGLQGNQRDVRLVNASFLYTEPHSHRIKVKLTLQKEVVAGAIVEQDCVVEFVIQPTQCDDCKRAFTPHTWSAVVQVRQKVQHKRSLMYLEQVILKNHAHEKVLKIVEATDGLDFQFSSKSAAQKFAEFVGSQLPTRTKSSKQLVSHDSKSNTAFNKHTFSLEISPICKDDLVYLPRKIANSVYGGISSFLICTCVTTAVQLIDPFTLRGVDIACDKYWRYPFNAVLSRRHLTEFIVLDIERVDMRSVPTAATAQRFLKRGMPRSKDDTDGAGMMVDIDNVSKSQGTAGGHGDLNAYQEPTCLADVEIARVSDFGMNDTRLQVRTHLGHQLRVGDYCLGYDVSTINLGGMDDELDLNTKILFDVILIRKIRKSGSAKRRAWILQRLPVEKPMGGNKMETGDLEQFKRDLEEDPILRKEVNLWKDPRCADATANVDTDTVALCELLEGLSIEDQALQFE